MAANAVFPFSNLPRQGAWARSSSNCRNMTSNTDHTPNIFDELQHLRNQSGSQSAVDRLIAYLESQGRFHEMFEALKMQLRLQLGLPAAQLDRNEKLSHDLELKLEQGLIEACRRVGEGFFKQGQIREGWMYMRPVGDRAAAAKVLEQIAVTDDNVDELLEVLLHEGVDVGRGYQLALDRLGTCNSITLFESALGTKARSDQQVGAALLVKHVHTELLANLKRDITKREGKEPEEQTAEDLLKVRPDLLRDGSYHLDTSHLASTVRYARVLEKSDDLRLALDLTVYGRHLHPQFQYAGEEPFLDLYPSSAAFFRALLGQQVDQGIRYFTQKADSVDQGQFGTIAIEVLIDLLARCGRKAEAMRAYDKRMPAGNRLLGIAPTMLELSIGLGEYQSMQSICRKRDDLLGYAAALLYDHPNTDSNPNN